MSTHVILKYSNRKYYSLLTHKYVTLKQIKDFYLNDTNPLVVVNNQTKVDITKETVVDAFTNDVLSKQELFSVISNTFKKVAV